MFPQIGARELALVVLTVEVGCPQGGGVTLLEAIPEEGSSCELPAADRISALVLRGWLAGPPQDLLQSSPCTISSPHLGTTSPGF